MGTKVPTKTARPRPSPSGKAKADPFAISPMEERTLEGVTKRVADAPVTLRVGQPKTDGKTVWLPVTDKSFSFYDDEGMAAHEGGHIRFRTIIGTDVPKRLCPENPKLAQLLMNIFEDARVNFLLRQTFPGYWDELNTVSARFVEKYIDQMAIIDPATLDDTKVAGKLVLTLAMLYDIDGRFVWDERLNDSSTFRFASKRMGRFWGHMKDAFDTLYDYLSFNASILATKKLLDAIREFLEDDLDKMDADGESDASEMEDGEKGKGGKCKAKKSSKPSKGKSPEKSDEPEDGESGEGSDGEGEPMEGDGSGGTLSKVDTDELSDEKSESGLSSKDLSPEERKRMERVLKSAASATSDEDMEKETEKDLTKDKEEMGKVIEKIKSDSIKTCKTPKCDSVDALYEDRTKIVLDVVRTAEDLKQVNAVRSSGTDIYDDIVHKNASLIHTLQVRFATIRNSQNMERGARRGLISRRDLAGVVASHGRFNRPFMMPIKSAGAYLVIAVDESGSMDHYGMQIAREAAVVFAEALKGTRIQFSVIGFGAVNGEERIAEKVYKALEEPVNKEKLGLMACAHKYVENRDGTSFRGIAKHHFHALQGGIPLMIVISDGRPCHGGTEYVDRKGMKDTADAVAELKQQGIRMFALSIDSSGDGYLRDIYGAQFYFVVDGLAALQNRLIFLTETLVRSVQ